MGSTAKHRTKWNLLCSNHVKFLKCELGQSKQREKREATREKPQSKIYSQSDNWHSQKTSHHFSSSSPCWSATLLLKLLFLLWASKHGGMFGWLSGKQHFMAHSCHSLGAWVLPLRVQWWGAGTDTCFQLRPAKRTWCESTNVHSMIAHCWQQFSQSLMLGNSTVFPSPHSFFSYFWFCASSFQMNKQLFLCSEAPHPTRDAVFQLLLMVTRNPLWIPLYSEVK